MGLAGDQPAAALPALALGVAKEAFDARRQGASRRDLVADAFGVALAALAVAALIDAR